MAFGGQIKDVNQVLIGQSYVPGTGFVVGQGSTLSNTDGSSNISTPYTFHRAPITVLNQASAAQTASGNSADLAVGPLTQVAIDVNVSAVTGTAMTLSLFVDRKGVDGIYYALWQSSVINGITTTSVSIGSGCVYAQSLGTVIRLRWVIAGTSPSFTFSASIIGK